MGDGGRVLHFLGLEDGGGFVGRILKEEGVFG